MPIILSLYIVYIVYSIVYKAYIVCSIVYNAYSIIIEYILYIKYTV